MNRLKFAVLAMLILVSSVALAQEFRTEHDLLGEMQIPAEAYYGIQAARAMENFQISVVPVHRYTELVNALALVKLAAARANNQAGALDDDVLAGIEKACAAIMAGEYHDQFAVDLYQGGAGTSTNMCANEVIANVALEKMGHPLGSYDIVEPHDDLNMSQSTNDFYPTALKVAMLRYNEPLLKELDLLATAFEDKGKEFNEILKMGRTELQDAVPMTMGQEFHAFGTTLRAQIATIQTLEKELYGVNMGGTAIGTKLNAVEGFPEYCAAHLAELTGKPIYSSEDLVAATSDLHGFVMYSSALRGLATRLNKTANDLILLSSGPRTGLYEFNLPAMQPGSSIMPGKVNPVMPELVNCVAMQVIGNDLTVAYAQSFGQLQLNAYEPVVAASILESQVLLINTLRTFREKCVVGITANTEQVEAMVERSIGIVTALNPVLGYETATEIAAEALETGKGVLEIVRERKLLDEAELEKILDPKAMTGQK